MSSSTASAASTAVGAAIDVDAKKQASVNSRKRKEQLVEERQVGARCKERSILQCVVTLTVYPNNIHCELNSTTSFITKRSKVSSGGGLSSWRKGIKAVDRPAGVTSNQVSMEVSVQKSKCLVFSV